MLCNAAVLTSVLLAGALPCETSRLRVGDALQPDGPRMAQAPKESAKPVLRPNAQPHNSVIINPQNSIIIMSAPPPGAAPAPAASMGPAPPPRSPPPRGPIDPNNPGGPQNQPD